MSETKCKHGNHHDLCSPCDSEAELRYCKRMEEELPEEKRRCVFLTHIPTKTKVKVDGRSQGQNKKAALFVLRARLKKVANAESSKQRSQKRKQQVGSGMRGDKIRTIRVRDNVVVDHRLNKRTTYREYCRGDFSRIR